MMNTDIEALRAENERLRAALEKGVQCLASSHFKNAEHIRAEHLMRTALTEQPGGGVQSRETE